MRPTPLDSLVCILAITVGLGALYMTPPPTAATPQAASLYGLLTEPWGAQGFQEVLGASGVEIPSPAALHAAYFGPAVDRHHDLDTVMTIPLADASSAADGPEARRDGSPSPSSSSQPNRALTTRRLGATYPLNSGPPPGPHN